MKDLIYKNKIFLIPYVFLSACILYLLLSYDKKTSHLFLTSIHSRFLDSFYSLVTHLGDGIFVIAAGIFLLLTRTRYGLLILISYSLSGLLVQLLKKTVFYDFNRPLKYFEDATDLHLVDGLTIHSYHSFPSGHATSAFALFFALCMITQNKVLKLISFGAASIVAYSRVYLSQHFLFDIWAGSVIGIVFAIITWLFLKNSKNKFLNKSLFNH